MISSSPFSIRDSYTCCFCNSTYRINSSFYLRLSIFSKNITTVIAVAHGRGIILCVAEKSGIPIYEYTPMQVKQAVVGYGLAEKHQVMDMTRRLLKLSAIPKPDDAADALAMAICHARSATSLLRRKDPGVKETI